MTREKFKNGEEEKKNLHKIIFIHFLQNLHFIFLLKLSKGLEL